MWLKLDYFWSLRRYYIFLLHSRSFVEKLLMLKMNIIVLWNRICHLYHLILLLNRTCWLFWSGIWELYCDYFYHRLGSRDNGNRNKFKTEQIATEQKSSKLLHQLNVNPQNFNTSSKIQEVFLKEAYNCAKW